MSTSMQRSRKRAPKRVTYRGDDTKIVRQTVGIVVATFAILGVLIFFGIPALTKLAIFFGDIRNSSTSISAGDTLAPAAPQLSAQPTATTSSFLDIDGFAEQGSSVTLYRNNVAIDETLADQEGQFVFFQVELEGGENRFAATATDDAGNESTRSNTRQVLFDSTSPELVITAPTSGQVFVGSTERVVTVTGRTDPGDRVRVMEHLVVVNSDGTFSGKYSLENGNNTIVVTATDAAGNTTTETVEVTFSD